MMSVYLAPKNADLAATSSASRALLLWSQVAIKQRYLSRLDGLTRWPYCQQSVIWLPHCRRIHSFGMRAPLDIIALDKQRRIVAVVRHLAVRQLQQFPRTARSNLTGRVDSLIECIAGQPWPLSAWLGRRLLFQAPLAAKHTDSNAELARQGVDVKYEA
ncbi:DUF192 domain-containing protein [Idiomarina xiamenensis]|uniref:DUF192 domain-containing protein n=1 Tax=Idiomarina xiamenensis 10-D-4 TaxID=740709 RepID=K2K5C3_9GAMM|nr:DUF192 domain-containing protein [Idiomarina xiamenensis]EKE82758.1 hypothetical protein A10D4_09139 [Idiomarina xiamenensis 10-D-4]